MKLTIQNFRSIKEQEVELAPLTVIYGPNGSGKSSLLYALLTLKNIVLNPNQAAAGFFSFNFMSLGGFEAVVHDHSTRQRITLGISDPRNGEGLTYSVHFDEQKARFQLTTSSNAQVATVLSLDVPLPYPGNQQASESVVDRETSSQEFTATWNGLVAQVQAKVAGTEQRAQSIASYLNSAAEALRTVAVIPLKRGFTKPFHSQVPVSPWLANEDEVATVLANEKYLVMRVSYYLEQILGRDFRVNVKPGTAIFSLDALDKQTSIGAELVNEGFGVNQIVHLLAISLSGGSELICVEEPEVHLHPTAIHKLAQAFASMVRNDNRRFIISTHSEQLVLSLLGLVAKGDLQTTELACYLVNKIGRQTRFELQSADSKGQIAGGLTAFMEAERESIQALLRVKD